MRLSLLTTAALVAASTLTIGLFTRSEASPAAPAETTSVVAEAKELKVDGGHSSVLFRIQHLNAAYFYGRFNEVSGNIVYDEANPSKSSVEIEVKAGSVDSNSANRDKHILSPDFLDAKQFPTLKFTSKSVEKEGALWKATGELAFHGTQHEVTLEFEKTGEGPGMRGGTVMGFHTRFTIERSDWGMDLMQDKLGNEIELTISLEAIGS